MKSKVSSVLPRVNFFDGQKITESDLDTEQLYNQSVTSGIINDFHGSGVVKDDIFESSILLDTSNPGYYALPGSVTSKETIEAGRYDGKPIYLDTQPSDKEYGNRLEFELSDVDTKGRIQTKILVLGYAFDSINVGGQLVYEVLSFETNKPQISKYYYTKVLSIILNNFSGGTGKTSVSISEDSLNLIGSSGKLIIKEVEPLKVYPAPLTNYQILSPSFDLNNFITYSEDVSIEDLIKEAIGSEANFNDLYFEPLDSKIVSFEKNGSVTVSYGQKFLARTNNIQRVDVLLSVDQDTSLDINEQYNFSGELVFSIHKLSTETQCATDLVPNNLIDFDPEIEPLMEISVSQEDLFALGIVLSGDPQVVNFNFSGTLLADPLISPTLEINNYYAFLISRRGDTSVGKVNLHVGYDEPTRREENNQPKNALQEFGNQISRYFEYDTFTKKYVDYTDLSLWHKIYSDTIEVTPGTAYSDDGFLITIPKYEEYIGDTKISNYIDNIPLIDVSSSSKNYVLLQHIEKFITPSTHPRTGNFVFTRIYDTGAISVVSSEVLSDLSKDNYPLIISKVSDKNARFGSEISGKLDKPGLIDRDYITLISPSESLFSENLVDRIFVPDTECDCTSKYRITKTECITYKVGDLNNNGSIEIDDLSIFLNYIGQTINSQATERKILNGEISYIGFKQSDVNGDDSVDGTDLELLEDAVDGSINFSVDKTFKVLKIYVENILNTSDYPVIFEDTTSSGGTEEGTPNMTFVVDDERKATIIRVGDILSVSSEDVGTGLYYITSKEISPDGITVTVSLNFEDGSIPVFNSVSGFNVSILSGTSTNILADNLALSEIPYKETSYKIDFIDSIFKSEFLEICDLRRFVSRNFIEEENKSCECIEDPCGVAEDCTPKYKNQSYVSGDIYIPNGEILSAPGVPYHGDIEYVTVTVPLPPGSIEDCQVDLYNTFIKSEGSSCITAAGYPAMKYSDGTYVGCEDSGLDTDISKGRVKITNAIASLHVDGLVDGYAVDGYADATSITNSKNIIGESFIDYSYTSFDTWSEDSSNSSIVTITHNSGSNEPATFELTTENSSGTRSGFLNSPSEISAMSGDLLVDFRATRLVWSSSPPQGEVSSYVKISVTNDDFSYSTLKFGWRQYSTNNPELFYSGKIYDEFGSLVYSFEHTEQVPDSVGDEILFRIRRIDDAFFVYYINPNKILDGISFENFGQYIRIGTNPEIQPGSGSVSLSFGIEQSNNPETGLYYATRFSNIEARSQYQTSINDGDITISRDSSSYEINRAAISFPIEINSRTNIISASLKLTLSDSVSSTDLFNIIPLAIINADNLATYYNYPVVQGSSYIETFSPGTLSSGDIIEVDITNIITKFVSEPGFLPGYYKAIIIEPDATAGSSLLISNEISIEISYEDITTGVIFKVGVSIDPSTGIASFKTKNILYDATNEENRTTIKFSVYLKKSGFANKDIKVSISDLKRIGLGSCADENLAIDEGSQCYFVVGTTGVGTYVEGPFDCAFSYPK